MTVAMVLFWVAVIVGVVLLVRSLGDGGRRSGGDRVPPDGPGQADRPTARDILDQRYARGEIDDEEYRARRDTLMSK